MFRKPLQKRYLTKHAIPKDKEKSLPDSDYDGMGDFSRFGRP
jgi:hypothetical protein